MLGQTKTKLPAQHLNRLLVQFVGFHTPILAPEVRGVGRYQKQLWVCLAGAIYPSCYPIMKTFKCIYRGPDGFPVKGSPSEKVEAETFEEAARTFASKYPTDHPTISIQWGVLGSEVLKNPRPLSQMQEEMGKQEHRKRLLRLYEKTGVSTGAVGSLLDLSYEDICDLVENMWEFPAVCEDLDPEERAIGEELYKLAFFDRSLQTGLQTIILNQIASGQPTTGAAGPGGSNLARNAAMLGGVAALQKLNQIEENTGDVSEGLGFD